MSHWEEFFRFPAGAGRIEAVSFRILRWRGREWLVLPRDASLASRALVLYPAQRRIARAAKRALSFALKLHLPLEVRKIKISLEARFVRFLAECGGTLPNIPELATLAGNPRPEGARHTFLIFDSAGRCCAVAKAGIGNAARTLIRREADFLQEHSGHIAGVPRFLNRLESDSISAIATEFVEGESPPPRPPTAIANLLIQWIDETNKVLIEKIPAWERLERAAQVDTVMAPLREAVAGRVVSSVMWHGDFTPWNIKVVSTGEWMVVDFDRSETCGVPAWDWLHYIVQAGILIERNGTASMVRRIDELLASGPFRQFAQLTGIAGIEREIAKAYLLYALYVLRPTEGAASIRALLSALA